MSVKKKPSAFTKLCQGVTLLATRMIDGHSFHGARISALEDRLAALDGGDDAKAARRDALFNVNADRVSAGREALAMKIDDDTGKATWTK